MALLGFILHVSGCLGVGISVDLLTCLVNRWHTVGTLSGQWGLDFVRSHPTTQPPPPPNVVGLRVLVNSGY